MDIYQRVTEQLKVSSWPLFTAAATGDTATNTSNSRLWYWRPLRGFMSVCARTHTHTMGTIKPCVLIRQPHSNWANPHFRIDCPRRSDPPLSPSPALPVWGLRLNLPVPSVAHVDCKAVYWETMGSRLCCQAPLISIISITPKSVELRTKALICACGRHKLCDLCKYVGIHNWPYVIPSQKGAIVTSVHVCLLDTPCICGYFNKLAFSARPPLPMER